MAAEQGRDKLRELAEQQAALRRVATLVAVGFTSSEVFAAVAEEIVRCLDMDTSGVWRFEPDNTISLLGATSRPGCRYLPVGERVPVQGDNLGPWCCAIDARSARTRSRAPPVRDDGIGGADSRKGSGLIGLKDRVEVLCGHMQITSQPGAGTSLHITIPVQDHSRR